ncbi:hypothetical protein MUK42_20058 [Musa troglodytarum]|uniref:Uncharacterized protein n=1 Tax=Musa troglodytarum TaxID=320322 RepID=A0A9E7JDZ6_9LILI|nr:hypothetical protein MUK42_20058 [Musa troglodytarum]
MKLDASGLQYFPSVTGAGVDGLGEDSSQPLRSNSRIPLILRRGRTSWLSSERMASLWPPILELAYKIYPMVVLLLIAFAQPGSISCIHVLKPNSTTRIYEKAHINQDSDSVQWLVVLQIANSGAGTWALRQYCLHELANKRWISVTSASKLLANMRYSYHGMGLSVGTMIAGWDEMLDCIMSTVKVEVSSYHYDTTLEEAAELACQAIYHATFHDGASGGIASVYHVKSDGSKKFSGDDVSELHCNYYPVVPSSVEQEMAEVPAA